MFRSPLKRFSSNRKGATAVEFAIVVPLFFGLIFSILEAGYFFFVSSAVEQANQNAARLVRTGQAQAGVDPDAFFTEICDVVDSFGDCNDKLTIDIARFANFAALAADASTATCRDASDPSIAGSQFAAADYGVSREIVRVRVCFLYNTINPALGLSFTEADGGAKKIISTSIFRNEPFDT